MVRQTDVKAELKSLFARWAGCEATGVEALPGAGSSRRYYRLTGNGLTAIGVSGADVTENRAFCRLAADFRSNWCNVPEVYGVSSDGTCYLQQDLGDVQLFSLLDTPQMPGLVAQCMKSLAHLQTISRESWSDDCFNRPFNRRQVMWDLNYFKYEYLKGAGVVFDEDALEDDFERMAELLSNIPSELTGFMYRDCQSRNVMVRDGECYWIDIQGGRVGPCVYDAISFLWQARAGFPADFRQKMLSLYADEFAAIRNIPSSMVTDAAPQLVLFRTLQVLGAYGFRGLVECKAHFIESIPGALANLRDLLDQGIVNKYPELERVCRELVADSRFAAKEEDKRLHVDVYSFSYKKGYPANYTPNGGGFMFDCRALHNPGRYDQYKPLTGLDAPVRDFLEERGEIQPFLESAWQLTDHAVTTYLRRGFTSLQIGFGCTGGRHRSVYSADATARHIAAKYPEAVVRVIHREQNIEETL